MLGASKYIFRLTPTRRLGRFGDDIVGMSVYVWMCVLAEVGCDEYAGAGGVNIEG